jgi:type III pantothenate kinase
MILLLDAGNARIKLGRLADGELTPIGAVVHRDVGLGTLMTELEQLSGPVQRVVACCVAGPSVRRELETAIRERFGIATEFVTAERQAAGVTNAYPQPGRLGADRWCAVIGAHAHGLGVACIVDAGSALTVDALVRGRHLGGLIAPGIGLMRAALMDETGDLRALSEAPLGGGDTLFATDTYEAIVRGTLFAAVSLIQRCRVELSRQAGALPALVLTGGDAEQLVAHFDDEILHLPWLTLDGLARIAVAGGSGSTPVIRV